MTPVFNFGISQDDPRSERNFFDLNKNDRILCLASGGEVPLDMVSSMEGVQIDAVDIDPHQIYLSNLKRLSALLLEPNEAASLIGYFKCTPELRKKLFKKVATNLSSEELDFWNRNPGLFRLGPIHSGRFEMYINKYNQLVTTLLGKKHLMNLMEMENVHDQENYFDRHFRTGLLKMIFTIAFHPRIYKNRGVVEEGLKHSGTSKMSEFFYSRFKSFCVSNLARQNGYYQFTFFNEILYPEALPDYLQHANLPEQKAQFEKINFGQIDLIEKLAKVPPGYYSKIALSNISDWLSKEEMSHLLDLIIEKSQAGTKILARYIHAPVVLNENQAIRLKIDTSMADELMKKERYPFYTLVPLLVE